jgi:hypothetical protein
MEFRTKLDFSTRQVRQYPETNVVLSGASSFGVTFSALTSGPDLATSGASATINGVVSTFSGNSSTTVYSWYDPSMGLGLSALSALTPSNSAITQDTGTIFTSNTISIIDGNTVVTSYSGISFDVTPISIIDLGGGAYSGSVYTDTLNFLSAGTLDYTGRTIWVDVSGITRTERMIITNLGAGPGSLDVGIDANGFLVNNASDVNLKENINNIDDALNKVLNLRGVTFNWKDRNSGGNATKIGFIAQEVNEVVPELTHHDGKYMSVHYKDVTALLVEAIKELVNGGVTINVNRESLNTQTVVAEDNNIELNYNGNHQTSIDGGIIVLHAIADNQNAFLATDENGDWTTNTNLKPNGLIIPRFTPTSSQDLTGSLGNLTRDEEYLYLKTENGWKRIILESF